MLRKFIGALAALSAWAGACATAPLEAYGKLPNIEQAAISPSGKLIAYIATDGDKRVVIIQQAGAHELIFKGRVGTARLKDITWAGESHLILTVATAKQPAWVIGPRVEHHLAFDLNLTNGRLQPLMDRIDTADDTLNTIDGYPEVRMVGGKPTVFVRGEHFVQDEGQPGLFQIELEHDRATLIAGGDHGIYDWVVDETGRIAAWAAYKDRNGAWTLAVRQSSGDWRMADKVTALTGSPDLVGMSADGKSVVVDYGDDSSGTSWTEVALADGSLSKPTANSAGESALLDPVTGRVIGKAALIGDEQRYTFFDPHDAAVWRSVTKAFPADLLNFVSWSQDRSRIIVHVDSAELGPAYALVDLNTKQAEWLGSEYPELTPEDISPKQAIRYKAADGLEITGYLTLPRARPAHGLPLVVLPHGGPQSRDHPGFDWWAQALASRGYAVLQPNFRGSEGFGWPFLSAGFGQWGRKMQTDLSDGVRYLAAQGTIDAKRVCIVGASYGGYAALAGATMDHGVYRCAVAVTGVANLRDMVAEDRDAGGRYTERYSLRFIGAANANDPVLTTYSPALRAREADIPILLIHGRDDTVVPISHSRHMADALRAAGKPVELVELPGEDHHLSRGETRLQMLQATVAFLEKNNPPN